MKMHLPICPSTRVAPFLAALVWPPPAAELSSAELSRRAAGRQMNTFFAQANRAASPYSSSYSSPSSPIRSSSSGACICAIHLFLSESQLAGRLAANNRWMCLPVTDNRCTSCLGCRPSLALFWPAQRPAASSVDLCWQWASSSAAGQQQQQRKTQSSS